MEEQEASLILQLKNNSQKAFCLIYRLYASRLFAFALDYCKSREVAEELVEDTFVWLWIKRHTIRQEHTLKALLFIRMRHFLINAYRSTVNSPQYENYLNYIDHLTEEQSDTPLEYNEFLQKVDTALRKLTKMQQKIVRLSKLEMKSNQEIAQLLGLKEQTVKNHLSAGLRTLRLLLGNSVLVAFLLFQC
ncbi:RNA polymerase sigma factor, sigma-70 family/RNA polymerase sigma-70 factor, Bacteroides expansion family 1 [Bacteroides heparinolyticus]|uniref:RNA polymerase sigma factor, sigma-70 family/RNA polymerase sigma-70 factor, Bacteroides expansion family 1 n=1 Tax=Prevotella heparinolytica TaxID=28113 RepID=A0A449I146_9BACE|nr:sigma-70 family RNA polymerase sigma factor [Bacteroides heparinolyticus]VFB13161.1 RNA polymerase sigma factor, sigma-70 family/RNA polymerase sigma-70 factor, Bacteroides expansion family 1 [Bacteroides heparinolyticus]